MPITAALEEEIIRGDDYVLQFTVAGSGSISAWTFAFALRERRNEDDAITPALSLSSGSGVAIADAEERVVEVTLTDDQTLALDRRDYWGSLKRTNSGAESTLWQGTVTVVNTAAR